MEAVGAEFEIFLGAIWGSPVDAPAVLVAHCRRGLKAPPEPD